MGAPPGVEVAQRGYWALVGAVRAPRSGASVMGRVVGILVVVWLVIGVLAAFQRGYFGSDQDVSCKSFADTGLTVLAGPLNYVGLNPTVDCSKVKVPQPSK